MGWLSQLKYNLPGTTNDLTQDFTYNTAGQIASAVKSNDAYVYDQQVNVERAYTNNGPFDRLRRASTRRRRRAAMR